MGKFSKIMEKANIDLSLFIPNANENENSMGNNVMSRIMDAMNKAKADRSNLDNPNQLLQEAKQSNIKIVLLHVAGVLILCTAFYFYFNKETDINLSPINDRLNQMDNKLGIITKQYSEWNDSLAMVNWVIAQGMTTSDMKIQQSKEIQSPPTTKIPQPVKQYHEVKSGETLYRIARYYGVSVEKLYQLNKLKQNSSIQPGQKLLIAATNKE